MTNYHGRLKLTSCNSINDISWGIIADFSDNTARFSAKMAQVGDVIYAKAENEDGDVEFKLFKIIEIDTENTKSSKLYATIEYAEDDEIVFTPVIEDDAMICRMSSEHGIAMLSNVVNKFSQDDVDNLRNLSLARFDKLFTKYVNDLHSNSGGGSSTPDLSDVDTITVNNLNVEETFKFGDDLINISSTGKIEQFVGEDLTYNTLVSTIGDFNPATAFINENGSINKIDTVSASTQATDAKTISGAIAKQSSNINGTDVATAEFNLYGADTTMSINLYGDNVSKLEIVAKDIVADQSKLTVNKIEIANINYDEYSDVSAVSVGYLKNYLANNSSGSGSGAGEIEIAEIKESLEALGNQITNLASGLEVTNNNISNIRQSIADLTVVANPGTYVLTTINENGFVTEGKNHIEVDITGTTNDSFTIGQGEHEYSWIYANKLEGENPVPYIRYNYTLQRWEFSNDGIETYPILISGKIDDSNSISLGMVDQEPVETIDLNESTLTQGENVYNIKDKMDINENILWK